MNNNLEVMFENIRNLCAELDDIDNSIFAKPATETVLNMWEEENGIKIPETYRRWLQLSKYSNICGGLVELFMPSANGYYSRLVPQEYVVIGNIIGDGERICFLKTTGEFVRYDHGRVTKVGDLENIILWVTEYLEIIINIATAQIQNVTKIELLRRQAVQGFWDHERQLLSNGQCTRQWNFNEIEQIYNINITTGNKKKYAGKPIVCSNDGKMIVDENGTPIYYEGHHMLSYAEHPEYVGNWKNIQALTPEEHILGAHAGR